MRLQFCDSIGRQIRGGVMALISTAPVYLPEPVQRLDKRVSTGSTRSTLCTSRNE